jgi:hypothetical protein
MDMKIIELTSGFTCPVCSGNQVNLPDEHTDETLVECANCEASVGSWGDIRRAREPMLSKKAEQDVKDILKAVAPDETTK